MPTTEEARAAASNFACESCGSQLLFDPDTQGLRCDHCGREEEIPALLVEAPEYLYNPMTDSYDAPNWEAMGNKTVRCKNCGAEEVVDAAAMTAACPFCGSQYVMDENEVTEGILPETLQPFKVSKVKAADLFKSWAKSRFWAPGAFKKTRHTTRELQGLYLPFWTFDADLYSQYTGEGGRDRTETYTTTDKDGHTQTHTRTVTDWYPISGDAALSFDDEAVCATTHVDKGMLGRLGAYDVKVLRRYSPAFLAGFGAQRYDVGVGHAVEHGAARGKLPGLRSLPVHAVQSPVQQREVQAHPAAGLDVVLFIQKQGIQLYDQRRDRRGGGQIPRQRPEGDPCGAAGTGARGADCHPADVFRQQLIVLHMKESWL